jgi:catechol 2,3-dioxygenase-like lactoylglutathione lyase family enzyme
MSTKTFIPPNVLPPLLQKFAPLLKRKWFRELVLLWPTLTKRRFSNKTEDYGVFKPSLVDHLGQLSIYVHDIERSKAWYQRVAGLSHSRTCEPELHPTKPGWTLRACYMSASEHEECLVLLEERDPSGKLSVSSGMSFFHFALELQGNSMKDVFTFVDQCRRDGSHINYGPVKHNAEPPLGDGETGGNVACYLYDPDWHNVEFCGEMDTVENYRARYGDKKGSERV